MEPNPAQRRKHLIATIVASLSITLLATACDNTLTTQELFTRLEAQPGACSEVGEILILQMVGAQSDPSGGVSDWVCGVADAPPATVTERLDIDWQRIEDVGNNQVYMGTSVDMGDVDRNAGRGVGHLLLLRSLIPMLESRSTVVTTTEVIVIELEVQR